MNKQYRVSSITETGRTIQSGWCKDESKMNEIFQDFKLRYPMWVHILESRPE